MNDLRNDLINTSPVQYDWSKGYGETWEPILPDVDVMPIYHLKDILDNYGDDYPEPNPFDMTVAELATFAVEEEVTIMRGLSLLTNITKSMEEEECWGLDEWRGAAQECLDCNQEQWDPVMSYYYPLYGTFGGVDVNKINHLPLTIIYLVEEDLYALALTGGGMDLSWEICEAHMQLGFYPPAYVRLPKMAGKTASDRNLWIAQGCIKSAQIAGLWANRSEEDIRRVIASLEKGTR